MKNNEIIKTLKGKMVLVPATFALAAGLTLAGCGDADALEPNTQTSEIVSEIVSEETTEEISEVISEETTEIASEVVTEDYSVTAVDTIINEITKTYPNEDARQIAAVVIGTNAKYMTEQEIDEALNTYGFTKEEVNQLFINYFETKGQMIHTHDLILEGATFEMPNYASLSPIYEYCLNEKEYNECVEMEKAMLNAFASGSMCQHAEEIKIVNDVESQSIAKMLILGTTDSYKEYYSECLPFETELEKSY